MNTQDYDLRRPPSVDAAGAALDAARQNRDATFQANRPRALGKVNPAAGAAREQASAAVADADAAYQRAIGNPGAATRADLLPSGRLRPESAIPALQTPPSAPAQSVAAPAAAAPVAQAAPAAQPSLSAAPAEQPVATAMAPAKPANQAALNVLTQPIAVPAAPAAAQTPGLATPPMRSTTDYAAMQSKRTADGTIQITGSGQSPEYLARMQATGRDQAGNLMQPGNLAVPPDVSTRLGRREFRAQLAMNKDRREDQELAGRMAESGARMDSGRGADARANFETQVKARKSEAERLLASGQYDKSQEAGLRLLAGLTEKYKGQIIKGDPLNGIPDRFVMYDPGSGHVVDGTTGETIVAGAGREAVKTSGPQMPDAPANKGRVWNDGKGGRWRSDGKTWVKA